MNQDYYEVSFVNENGKVITMSFYADSGEDARQHVIEKAREENWAALLSAHRGVKMLEEWDVGPLE